MFGKGPRLLELRLRKRLPVGALFLVVAVVGGCNGLTDSERDEGALIQTDALTYTLQEAPGGQALKAEIPYRYENRTNSTICIENCRGSFSVGLMDESGEIVWSPVVPLCLSQPITIAAGESYRDTLHVFHGLEPNLHPKFKGDPEGTFRIDIMAARRNGESCGAEQVSRELRVSNAFKLERR